MYHTHLKSRLADLRIYIYTILSKKKFFRNLLRSSFYLLTGLIRIIKRFIKRFIKIIYVIVLNFSFHKVYQRREKIQKFIKKLLVNGIRLYILYLILYLNWWGLLFNYFFIEKLESFIVWDLENYSTKFNILLSLLNLDNLALFIYIAVVKVGLYTIYSNDFYSNYLAM